MWKAACENNASYDGIFFYAVKSTGIYCRPSCKSKKPKRDNICFFETAGQAESAGFRPCKRCRSDLLSYQPVKDIVVKVKTLIDDMFRAKKELDNELHQIGVSQRRIAEIFKEQYGVTPLGYVNDLRLKESKKLLIETDSEIIDIAYSVGFGSLSSFYRFFKSKTSTTPAEFRKENRKL